MVQSRHNLLLVMHAPTASGLLYVANHVMKQLPESVASLDIYPDEPYEKVLHRAQQTVQKMPPLPSWLLLTDLAGSTPCNYATRLAQGWSEQPSQDARYQARVLCGVNTAMLLRCLCYANMPLEDLCQKAVEGGRMSIFENQV